MYKQNSKLNSYFENLRTCNVISSLMGQVGSLPSTAAAQTAASLAAAPTTDMTAVSAADMNQAAAPGGGFGNYLSKLQTICTDGGEMGGGGQHKPAPMYVL